MSVLMLMLNGVPVLRPLLGPGQIEYVGFTAALLTTSAFVPQLVRVLKTRSARDISLGTFSMFSLGVFLWLVYGLWTGNGPVIASNSVTLLLSLAILILKVKLDRSTAHKPNAGLNHRPATDTPGLTNTGTKQDGVPLI